MPEPSVRLTISDRGIGSAVIDVPDGKVNALSETLMTELNQIIDQVKADKNIRALIISSAKSDNFIAGADVFAIKRLQREAPKNAYDAAQSGKQVYQKLERLTIPTIAAIHGSCLGGGTELT